MPLGTHNTLGSLLHREPSKGDSAPALPHTPRGGSARRLAQQAWLQPRFFSSHQADHGRDSRGDSEFPMDAMLPGEWKETVPICSHRRSQMPRVIDGTSQRSLSVHRCRKRN